ncbi:MAG TPA: hypothetical protein ENN67_04345 [Firmicutes bacterium]|nr:hypothetical protein [Bacillota bacterium]
MVDSSVINAIFDKLKSDDSATLVGACDDVKKHAREFNRKEIEDLTDAISSLFYLDTDERPELAPAIEASVSAIVALGPDSVGALITQFTDTDLKANILIAKTLGKMGHTAAVALIDRFRNDPDPYHRSMALFDLSRIDDPALIDIFPEVVSAMEHENPELRDTAALAVGRMAECLGEVCLAPDAVNRAFDALMKKLSDPHAGARSKAVRSIGKLAKSAISTMNGKIGQGPLWKRFSVSMVGTNGTGDLS